MSVKSIGIAGAGTMGAGIAQVACLGGFSGLLHDPDANALDAAAERIRADLARGAERGRWSRADAEAASARLRLAPELGDLGGCELVIEAAPEDADVKRELFAALAEACGAETVLATNTSSLSVSAIASAAEHPARVCGMHFFNPPALMALVEIVAGEQTADETLELATETVRRMGRTPVRVRDAIGFIANRCARPFTLEAMRLVGERIAPPSAIDRIVRLGGGYRMGPFELMDLIGVDVNLAVARSFYEQSGGEPRWRPHPLQQRLVSDGRLGRKSGRGWFAYGEGPHQPSDPAPPPPAPGVELPDEGPAPLVETPQGSLAEPLETASLASLAPAEDIVGYVALPTLAAATVVELTRGPATSEAVAADVEAHFRSLGKHVEWVGDAPGLVLGRIVAQLINEGCHAVSEGIAAPDDVDTAMRLGFNHPRGPFEWAEAIGPERALAILNALRGHLGKDRYGAATLLERWARDAVA